MNAVTQKGYAKINLGLDVLRRREDGYHELRMIMQTVNLFDEITITKTDTAGVIELTANRDDLPLDEHNLIYKAAKIMADAYQLPGGMKIHLTKSIPMAAGMAGGSADAAATFLGINRLYELNLPKEELCIKGVCVGADVPYCIMGGTFLAEGIGEILTPLRQIEGLPAVIVKPAFDVSTGYVYGNLHAESIANHPDIDGQIAAIEKGDYRAMADLMGNVLQNVTIVKYPQIETIKEQLLSLGSFGSMMSGSGPSVFGLFEEKAGAEEAAAKMQTLWPDAFVCATKLIPVCED